MLFRNVSSNLLLITFPVVIAQAVIAKSEANEQSQLNLQQAIDMAVQNDIWLDSADFKQQALLHRAKAAGTLPDPKVSIDLLNMPTDSFNFEQEAMTQFRLGATQALPRGKSLSIKQDKLTLAATELPILKQVRQAQISKQLSLYWLDAHLAKSNIALLEQNMPLFEQMIDIAKASYSSAVANTRQQDVISAQVELVKLQSQLIEQQQVLVYTAAKLSEWLDVNLNENPFVAPGLANSSKKLNQLLSPVRQLNQQQLSQLVSAHPEVKALQIQYSVAEKDIALRQQDYEPQWSLKASYGYRDHPSSTADRADLVSIGVSFDVPLFAADKQDQNLAAARAQASAVKLQQTLKIRELQAGLAAQLQLYQSLSTRQALYSSELLVQLQQQSEATLTAYTNDDGQFSEVLQARISELETKLMTNQINTQLSKAIIGAEYYLVATSNANFSSTGAK